MNDIAGLEQRINLALERIGAGLDALDAGAMAPVAATGGDSAAEAHLAEVQEALEAERTTNAQLTERVRAIREKQETMVGALEKKVAYLTEQVDTLTQDLQLMKKVNDELADANHALSTAAAEGIADPELLNAAILTELQALRAARAADVAEMDDILSELKPLIGEVA
ncbi:MAG: hypothetical protein R3D46_04020 [Defluviimonas denitrificans]